MDENKELLESENSNNIIEEKNLEDTKTVSKEPIVVEITTNDENAKIEVVQTEDNNETTAVSLSNSISLDSENSEEIENLLNTPVTINEDGIVTLAASNEDEEAIPYKIDFLYKKHEGKQIVLLPKTLSECIFTSTGENIEDYLKALQLNNNGSDIVIDDSFPSNHTTYSSVKTEEILQKMLKEVTGNTAINGLIFNVVDGILQVTYDDEE